MNYFNHIKIIVLLCGIGGGGRAYGQQPVATPAPGSEGAPLTTLESVSYAAERTLEHSIATVQPALDRYGYAASFVAVMVEGMGIPAPGQTLLVASALDAAKGRLNISLLLMLVTLAAALGNSVGYLIGLRRQGPARPDQCQQATLATAGKLLQQVRQRGARRRPFCGRSASVERHGVAGPAIRPCFRKPLLQFSAGVVIAIYALECAIFAPCWDLQP